MRLPPEILLAPHDELSIVPLSASIVRLLALFGVDKVNEVRITDYDSIGAATS
jgi:hypothetical protein